MTLKKPWSREQVYDEKIEPLMKQIIAICEEHEIPIVAQFQYDDSDETGPGYVSTAIMFEHASRVMNLLAGISASEEEPILLASIPLRGNTTAKGQAS